MSSRRTRVGIAIAAVLALIALLPGRQAPERIPVPPQAERAEPLPPEATPEAGTSAALPSPLVPGPAPADPQASFYAAVEDFSPHMAEVISLYLESFASKCGTALTEQQFLARIHRESADQAYRQMTYGVLLNRPDLIDEAYTELSCSGGYDLAPPSSEETVLGTVSGIGERWLSRPDVMRPAAAGLHRRPFSRRITLKWYGPAPALIARLAQEAGVPLFITDCPTASKEPVTVSLVIEHWRIKDALRAISQDTKGDLNLTYSEATGEERIVLSYPPCSGRDGG